MGQRGPRPKPTIVRRREGNAGKRKINTNEPEFSADPVCPAAPEFLTAAAREEWDRVAPELFKQGLLKTVDRMALAGYCQSWARWVDAEKFINENGTVIVFRDDSGNVKYAQPAPQIAMARAALDNMRRFAAEFGMTPSARSRVSADAPKENADPWAGFGLVEGGKSGKKK